MRPLHTTHSCIIKKVGYFFIIKLISKINNNNNKKKIKIVLIAI